MWISWEHTFQTRSKHLCMLVQHTEGDAQPLTDAGNKMGAKPEPAKKFSFPSLEKTKGVITPHMHAKPEVKGMLLSGSHGFFHADLSCMLASLYALLHFCTNSGTRPFLLYPLHMLNAAHCKGLEVVNTGQMFLTAALRISPAFFILLDCCSCHRRNENLTKYFAAPNMWTSTALTQLGP